LTIAYPALLSVIALVLFSALIIGIRVSDAVFMHLISDYLAGKHFNFFDSSLVLNGSNYIRYDVRPVLEIDKNQNSHYYLAGQVFESYENGIWQAPEQESFQPVPETVNSDDERIHLVMYEYLKGVVPVPRGVTAMQSKRGDFEKDKNGIVVNYRKTIPQMTLSVEQGPLEARLSEDEFRRMLQVPYGLSKALKSRAEKIVGQELGAIETVKMVEQYFRMNFDYTLDVKFNADDQGLLYMLDHQSPAYCSFFASAMTLILRQKGIPSRVVGGFLAAERSRVSEDKFIVRGKDAHAWVEVFVPAFDPKTEDLIITDQGEFSGHWVRFDPTPPDQRLQVLAGTRKLNLMTDYVWCTIKRMRAGLLDVETKTLAKILFVLVLIIAGEELLKKYVWKRLKFGKGGRRISESHQGVKQNQSVRIYHRFEAWIKKKFEMERKDFETDAEWIIRLQDHQNVGPDLAEKISRFISQYQAARFGMAQEVNLDQEFQSFLDRV